MQNDHLAKITQELAGQLQLWRQSNKAPTKIPADYWAKAVELAAQQGVSKTAQALRLDYMSLKRRLDLPVRTRRCEQGATFLEWLQPVTSIIAECTMRVTTSSGAKLTVRIKNVSPAGLGSLLRDFVGPS
jgi:hypothetical protein